MNIYMKQIFQFFVFVTDEELHWEKALAVVLPFQFFVFVTVVLYSVYDDWWCLYVNHSFSSLCL